jgi:2-octaprenyl-6-methoxyphenol hydroxylase
MTLQTDVLIVGGGPVGASLALLLAGGARRITLLEARPAGTSDARTLTISHGTALLLARLGVHLPALGATRIETIHVSQRGGFGRTVIRAAELGVPALGYVLSYAQLTAALEARLRESDVSLRHGARASRVEGHSGYACAAVEFDGVEQELTAGLLVLAEGGRSLETLPGVHIHEREYRQHAVVATVASDPPAATTAYERFTPQGPIALLPKDGRYALVWTAASTDAQRLCELAEDRFLDELAVAFGRSEPRFESVGARNSFPLRLRHVRTPTTPRLVMIGNAAQTLHPVAGQGFNIGMRDAWTLACALKGAAGEAVGAPERLARYRAARHWDARAGVVVTDLLARGFLIDMRLARLARGLGLAMLDTLPPLRRWFARRMMFGLPGQV